MFDTRGMQSTSILTDYLRTVSEHSQPDPVEERDLARRSGLGDARAREELALRHQWLVLQIARKYAPTRDVVMDLVQEGNRGLLRAIEGFDAERGCRLSTYAPYWIRAAIQRHRRRAGGIRLPRRVWQAGDAEARSRALHMVPLEAVPEPAVDRDSQHGAVERRSRDAAVATLLQSLTTRERDVLVRRYGLASGTPETLERIGEELSLSKEGVRQIERTALDKLRHPRRARAVVDFWAE